jgi:endonuclease-8
MAGSWHVYRPGDRWRLPRHLARVLLRSAEIEAVCFRAPVVELLSPAQEERHRGLSGLGPDLLADGFDPLQARDNLRALVDHEIGAALLDQRALAGLGNVYRSEVLFVSRQSPFAKVEEFSGADIDRLIEQARRLLRANVVGSHKARVTTGIGRRGAELWVYSRAGRPCRRCGASILSERQDGRLVYWCPSCQA